MLILGIAALAQDSPPTPPIPSYFVIAPQAQLKPDSIFEEYGETELVIPHGEKSMKNGEHWAAALTVSGVPDGVEPDDVWVRQIKPPLVNAGWTFLAEERGQPKISHYQRNGHDTWLMLWAFGNDDMRFDLVEVGLCRVSLKIPKPAGKPETVSPDSGDFPFLPPMPGSTLTGSHPDDAPMIVTVDLGNGQQEEQVAGIGSIIKAYNAPPFPSPVLFQTVYSTALVQAGWKVVHAAHSADAVVIAHYAAGSRNIWAYLRRRRLGLRRSRSQTRATSPPDSIATAGSDEGRARNRRVELRKQGCTAQERVGRGLSAGKSACRIAVQERRASLGLKSMPVELFSPLGPGRSSMRKYRRRP